MNSQDKIMTSKGRKKLVKCVVCGAVFDADMDICPVCGVGSEYFIPHEEKAALFQKNTNENFVILGNGIAGISAAEAIRQRNETCNITIISSEKVLGYNRPMLTKKLSILENINNILIYDEAWYENNRINNILAAEIQSIDRKNKKIIINGGEEISYDKCIYALGATCFIPPIAGADKDGVIAIRNIADVEAVRDKMKSVKNVVVIGGGVLGLEAAWELSKEAKVTVLEIADKLMGRQLDDMSGEMLADLIKSTGIDFKVNANITEISGENEVNSVKLASGEEFPAELVIVSCGIRASTEIANEIGLAINRAIIVDDKMQTNDEYIYACGDCAEYNGVNYGIWPEAMEMGKIAGANAAGDDIQYIDVPPVLTFEGMDTSLFSAGDNGKNPNYNYKTVEIYDNAKKQLEKYYFHENKLVGVILIGDITKMMKLTEALNEGKSFDKMFKY